MPETGLSPGTPRQSLRECLHLAPTTRIPGCAGLDPAGLDYPELSWGGGGGLGEGEALAARM